MEYEKGIMDTKSGNAHDVDAIIIMEQMLGGKGESSIIRYY